MRASSLRPLDAAFVRRSDGRWCYAILAEKISAPGNDRGDDGEGGCVKLRFVVDVEGATKTISFGKWGECARMVRRPL